MQSVTGRLTWWSLAIFLVAFSNGSISKEDVEIRFSFAPGGNISFVQKLTTIKEKDIGDKGRQVDESVSTTKITMTRTKAGWNVLAKPKSIIMKRNGKVIDNPIASLLSSAEITYKLDSAGNIIDIEGYDAFIDGISKKIPPKIFKQLAPVLNVEALKAKDEADWNGRIGDYLGIEVSIGDSFVTDVPFELPDGSTIHYNTRTKFLAIEPCAGKRCVRIDQVYDSQADNVAKITGGIVNNVTKAVAPGLGNSHPENNSASISGTVSRLIDPDTMLIHTERVTRIMEMKIDMPGSGLVPVKVTETRLYEFQY